MIAVRSAKIKTTYTVSLRGPNLEARNADLHRLIEAQTQLTNEPAKSLGKVMARMPHCISLILTLSDILYAAHESK